MLGALLVVGKIASEKDSIFGPDGYEDTPQDMVEAYASAVFIEDNFPSPEESQFASIPTFILGFSFLALAIRPGSILSCEHT
jgi:hypothetical protein